MPVFNVSEIMAGSRALLNDQDGDMYTNTVQLPYFKIAIDELKSELKDYNIPISNRTSAAISILTGVTDIGGPSGPALPLDFVEPIAVWERTLNTNNDYLLMDRRQFLPKTNTVTMFLQVWEYSNQFIKLLGANSDLDVKIDYVGDPFADIYNENSSLTVKNSENFLKYKNAALCAEFIGENETRAASLQQKAADELDTLLNISIKSAQRIYTRRRPFRSRAKINGNGGGW